MDDASHGCLGNLAAVARKEEAVAARDRKDQGNSDSDSSSSSENSYEKVLSYLSRSWTYREAEEIRLHPLPAANQFRAWGNSLYQMVNAASGRDDDLVFEWMPLKGRCHSNSFWGRHEPLYTLERKLGSA